MKAFKNIYKIEVRRGSRKNIDRFPKLTPKAQVSMGSPGAGFPRKCYQI